VSDAKPEIRPARVDEVDALVHVLVRAFENDPYQRWMFPDDAIWERACHRSFHGLLRGLVPHGTVFTTSELDGCIVWYTAGFKPSPRMRLANLGDRIRIARLIGWRHTRVVRKGLLALHDRRPREPHIVASILGVLPERQGSGTGSALLRELLGYCDRTSQVVGALVVSESLVGLYRRRFGFETNGPPLTLPGDGPTAWPMLYRPKPRS
jgi:GNAT superfamily N-acetyltransferase